MKANRNHKDTFFRSLFSDKENLLELFNALAGTDFKDPQAIEINTLEDILFMGMKNDISFTIDKFLVLIEHQSTINEFMSLRMSMYFFRLLEKLTIGDSEKQYGERSSRKKRKKLPHPMLIVLYNGKEDYPAVKTLKVASLFVKIKGFKKVVDIDVKVININKGCNPELESRSNILAGYITFIAKVREYEIEHSPEEAMRLTIKYCIENNILKKYLIQHSGEVMSMLTAEFNLDEYKKVKYLEGVEDGIEEGEKRIKDYVLELMEQGLSYEEIKKKLEKTSKKKHK